MFDLALFLVSVCPVTFPPSVYDGEKGFVGFVPGRVGEHSNDDDVHVANDVSDGTGKNEERQAVID